MLDRAEQRFSKEQWNPDDDVMRHPTVSAWLVNMLFPVHKFYMVLSNMHKNLYHLHLHFFTPLRAKTVDSKWGGGKTPHLKRKIGNVLTTKCSQARKYSYSQYMEEKS